MNEIGLMDFVKAAKKNIQEIDVEEAEKRIFEQSYRVLDVREPGEYAAGAIAGSINIPRGIVEAAADRDYPDANPELRDHREANWLIVCRSGARAAMVADVLQKMGFTNVVNVLGGFEAWKKSGKKVVS